MIRGCDTSAPDVQTIDIRPIHISDIAQRLGNPSNVRVDVCYPKTQPSPPARVASTWITMARWSRATLRGGEGTSVGPSSSSYASPPFWPQRRPQRPPICRGALSRQPLFGSCAAAPYSTPHFSQRLPGMAPDKRRQTWSQSPGGGSLASPHFTHTS